MERQIEGMAQELALTQTQKEDLRPILEAQGKKMRESMRDTTMRKNQSNLRLVVTQPNNSQNEPIPFQYSIDRNKLASRIVQCLDEMPASEVSSRPAALTALTSVAK